jgi:hypothetical protein
MEEAAIPPRGRMKAHMAGAGQADSTSAIIARLAETSLVGKGLPSSGHPFPSFSAAVIL